jgi:L-asparaginase
VGRASRCLLGGVVGAPADALPSAGALTPAQARIELMLDLLTAMAA